MAAGVQPTAAPDAVCVRKGLHPESQGEMRLHIPASAAFKLLPVRKNNSIVSATLTLGFPLPRTTTWHKQQDGFKNENISVSGPAHLHIRWQWAHVKPSHFSTISGEEQGALFAQARKQMFQDSGKEEAKVHSRVLKPSEYQQC